MNIDAIQNGIVIDHITAGRGMRIYELLGLDALEVSVAIIKIDSDIAINFDVLGFVDPGVTVNIIRNGERVDKRRIDMPETLKNVIRCKNPRCITSVERSIDHLFRLTDRKNKVYRCVYCETKAQ